MLVKFHDEPLPFYCSVGNEGVDTGAEGGGGGGGGVEGAVIQEGAEGAEIEEKPSLRQQLEKGFEDDRKSTAKQTQKKAPRRVAGGAEIDTGTEGGAAPVIEGQEEQALEGQAQAVPVPEAFSKEAKAEWAKTPPVVQNAMIKREQDMAKGVEELKGKYVEIDKALQPHLEAIRRHGHTPAQAVNQLFSWFQALGANPTVAFPALAQSFGFDLKKVIDGQQGQTGQQVTQQQGGQQQAGAQLPADTPAPLKDYIGGLEKKIVELTTAVTGKIGTLESTFQQQAEARTSETLQMWAKDKPHFEEVRQFMAHLIGSGAVALKDGKIDLDGAYDMALYAMPEVRTKVLAAQRETEAKAAANKVAVEQKAQTEAAAKARRAGTSVGTSAPAAPGAQAGGRQRGKGKSVRESLMESIDTHRT